MTQDEIKALVRAVPDFPTPGILFRDITTLISHGEGFAACTAHLARMAEAAGAEVIAGMEARGFIFGAAVAAHMRLGFVPVRKPGKLPVRTVGIDYALEYGRDRAGDRSWCDPQRCARGDCGRLDRYGRNCTGCDRTVAWGRCADRPCALP